MPQLLERKYGSWGWPNEAELYKRVMADVVDDTREHTIVLAPYALMAFHAITIPAQARPGDALHIEVAVVNNGGAGTAWWRAIDIDTGEEIMPRYEFPVEAGDVRYRDTPFIWTPVMPNKNFRIRFELGHVE